MSISFLSSKHFAAFFESVIFESEKILRNKNRPVLRRARQKKFKVKLDDFNPQQLAEFLTVELVAQVQLGLGGAKKLWVGKLLGDDHGFSTAEVGDLFLTVVSIGLDEPNLYMGNWLEITKHPIKNWLFRVPGSCFFCDPFWKGCGWWPPTKGLKTCFFWMWVQKTVCFFTQSLVDLLVRKTFPGSRVKFMMRINEVREDASLYTEMKQTWQFCLLPYFWAWWKSDPLKWLLVTSNDRGIKKVTAAESPGSPPPF